MPGMHTSSRRQVCCSRRGRKSAGGRAAPPYAMNALHQAWEEVGWSSHAISTTGMVGTMIRLFGTDELKRDVLTKIVAGEAVCSLGYSEPGCGSDVFAAQTRATRDGDGWRIDGSKMFTSGANIADYVLMLTRTNPDVPKHKGLTMFIVPLKTPGVTIQPVFTFQDERTNITYYDGVKVKDSYRLGAVDGGVKVMAGALEMEHGGGFAKSQRHMVHAAEELCREIQYRGRPLIEETQRAGPPGARDWRMCCSRKSSRIAPCGRPRRRCRTSAMVRWRSCSRRRSSSKTPPICSNLTAPYSLSKRIGPGRVT